MNLSNLVKEERNRILELAHQHGATNVRIFGSVARGEAKESSDIDFLVDMESGRSLFDLGGLLMDLQYLLHCKVDIGTTKMLKESMRDQVLKETVAL